MTFISNTGDTDMTYQITTAPSYQCDGKRVPTIQVFDASGATIGFCRRRHFEAKAAWIARALSTAA